MFISITLHCALFIIVYSQFFLQLNQVEELSMKVDRLQRQIRATKDKESITTAEMKKLKDDLSRSDQATFCSSWNDRKNWK